ncbi:unnamed protein product [Didymodactylos carnosus]|uniref:Uncharacterized protein n=1 Tax=Didymodactylos carnosus TaxID=1234261 RepID=A0A813PJ92_9BILA|nr:unnamed protein product [Didymodactylos carnosus]CAF1289793.1 unnamed protein product [Didymodactylos carnosus]CAF3531171.1 unnamed protein product [Didymodactylos carnosus]CAF4094633.1 unnamed protein product [Didymodactylos carnosus]
MISQLYGETTNMTALTELVIPMVWAYVDDVTTWFDDIFWARLSYFREIWVSSSYKGSSGELALLSYVGHYYRNQESWLRAMHHANKQHFINFKGVAITGWSRYDHFLSLCELMPSAIPSLAYALYTARYGQITSVSNNTIGRQILGCSQIPIWEKTQYPTYITCTFPGHELYEVMFQYEGLAKQYDEVMSFTKLYVNDLHLRYNFIHYKRAQECQNKLAYLDEQMERFIDTFQQVCTLYFTPDVAIEWLQTYFMRSMNEVRNRLQFIERALKTQTYWQPRPIPNITKLVHVKKYSKANNNLERINQ